MDDPEVNFSIQSEYRKIHTRNNFVFGHFSHSVYAKKVSQNAFDTIQDQLRIRNCDKQEFAIIKLLRPCVKTKV